MGTGTCPAGKAPTRQLIGFTRQFTDGSHHGKEERSLFPALKERRDQSAILIAAMLLEHEGARRRIAKEHHVLFPMVDRVFTAYDQQRVAVELARIEVEETGADTYERRGAVAVEIATAAD